MDMIEGILSRQSCPKLVTPAPNEKELKMALACADRAPDYGRLKPWSFHVVSGDARKKLGEVFVRAGEESAQQLLNSSDSLLTDRQREKLLAMPLRAPLIVVVGAKLMEHKKISGLEQCLAVGAAMQNLQLAFHGMGYSCMWRTGEMALSSLVKENFGLSPRDEIVGFLYVGTDVEKGKNDKGQDGSKDAAQLTNGVIIRYWPEGSKD